MNVSAALRAGRLLLFFGMAVIALQAASEIALAWCVAVARFGCSLREQPDFYRYIYGILPVCLGTGIIALAPLVDVLAKLLEHRLAKSPDSRHKAKAGP